MNKEEKIKLLKESVRDIKDFPKKGVVFKDITTLLNDNIALNITIDLMIEEAKKMDVDFIVGLESRGFIFSTPIAYALNKGFVPIRKAGKLPADTISKKYDLEYGEAVLEIHKDAFRDIKNPKVLIVDDLLATGGTIQAAISLIEQLGGNIAGCIFLMELKFLNARARLNLNNINSLVKID